MTILIADDHTIFREGLAGLLQNLPYVSQVIQAGNGEEAVSAAAAAPIDIVLMDIDMPVMNGVQATQLIKSRFPHTAVIALTMFNRYHDLLHLHDAGADGYVLKDSSLKELDKALQLVQEGKEYYCEAVRVQLFSALLDREKNKPAPADTLSAREKEILVLICHQFSTEEIAAAIFVSPLTVNNHRAAILRKTKARNVAGLVVYALQQGIYQLPEG